MTRENIFNKIVEFAEQSPLGRVSEDIAILPDVAGMKFFDAPILAVGSASDEMFEKLKEPEALGPDSLAPEEWLPGAKSVITIFFPFSKAVRDGNRRDMAWPSPEWLHARIEGQVLIKETCLFLISELERAGHSALAPSFDPRFKSGPIGKEPLLYTSNWSERHAAFICGLGTFGLARGILTEKGAAGRLGSIVTSLPLEPDIRRYKDLYDYCTMCGVCAGHCPAGAISPDLGKDHPACSAFLDRTMEKHSPRYGCGKCQVGVPCETGIPASV